jgi:hypothetical protein
MSDHRKPSPIVTIDFVPPPKHIVITDDWYEQQLKLRAVHEAAPGLLAALERMLKLHRMMMKDVNLRDSALQAETIREMNEAPSQAIGAIKQAGGKTS